MTDTLVVVFGGTGFLGRRVVEALAEAGCRVRVAARRPQAQPFPGIPASQLEYARVDLRHEEQIRQALDGASAAVNAVSLYMEKGGLTFQEIHVEAAVRLARCAQQAGLHQLVHVSGLGVDVRSPSAYVSARARGEEAVRDAFAGTVAVRPSVMIGCDDAFLSSLNMVTRLRLVPLFGNGGTRLQPAYVEDVASAIARLIVDASHRGSLWELGGGKIYSYREALEAVADFFGRRILTLPIPFALWHLLVKPMAFFPSPPLTRDQLILMQNDNVADPSAPAFAALGIRPRSLEEVLPLCFDRG